MSKQLVRYAVMIACGNGLVTATPVLAQQIEEIVVTAQKRSESVQDIGLSITALSAADIQASGMNNAWDIAQQTPNMRLTSFFAQSRPEIVIRGVGQNNTFGSIDQSPAGVYNDEVYVGARAAQLTQMFDLERVEVLRGPQGTLYGRNTTGGAINFISRKPSFDGPNFSAALTAGNYGKAEAELAGGAALSDRVAFRAAGIYRYSEGFTDNLYTGDEMSGIDGWGGRLQLAFKATDNVDLLFNLHGSYLKSDSPAIHHLGLGNNEPNFLYPHFGGPAYQETGDFQELSNDHPGFEKNHTGGGSIHLDIDGLGATWTTIVSYDSVDTRIREDSTGDPIDYFSIDYDDEVESLSFEQRVADQVEGGALDGLDWVVGLYYYTDEVNTTNTLSLMRDPIFVDVFGPGGYQGFSSYTQDSFNWAAFGDVQYPLTDSVQLNLGLRYTFEEKEFDWILADSFDTSIPIADKDEWDAVTGRVGIDWRPSDDVMLYASYSRGFKSGGYNGVVLNPPAPSPENLTYEPEYADAYEIGVKSEWFDRQLRLNAAVFRTELTDQQTLIVLPGNIFTVQNAAESIIDGAEFEVQWQPTDALYIQSAIGLMDARYDAFRDPSGADLKGNPLPAAPDVTFSGTAEYAFTMPGGSTVTPRFEWSYTDDLNFDRYGDNRIDSVTGLRIPSGVDIQEAYWITNAALTWRSADEKYSVMAWVHNLADEEYWVKTIGNFADTLNGGGASAYPGDPRTYGVTVRMNFE